MSMCVFVVCLCVAAVAARVISQVCDNYQVTVLSGNDGFRIHAIYIF